MSMVVPILVLFAAFNLFPIIYAIAISFTSYDLFSAPKYIGLNNYLALLKDPAFLSAVRVTITYTLLFSVPAWLLGFGAAALLKSGFRGRGAFRSVYFVPTVLSSVAMAITWSLLLRQDGPVNGILGLSIPWLTNDQTAILGIAMLGVWQSFGWFMVVFLAGMLAIPETFYEAAKIDGAGRLALLRTITLPMLRPVFAVVVIQTIVAGMKVFSPMFIMTGGGPNNATRSVAMLIYQDGLTNFEMGKATAISVIGLVAMLFLTLLYLRVFRATTAVGD
jgi:ABC-type sugar transport system permease subunit